MAKFRLYNTMTRKKEVFRTIEPGKVSMYLCGITAYDLSHVGHARGAIVFDVLQRYLKELGYKVTYVRNFTDVDDKIIDRVNKLREDPNELPVDNALYLNFSNRFCEEYRIDLENLQCLPPTHEPRVSGCMEQIKDMIAQIIENGYGYVVDEENGVNKSVYFAVVDGEDEFPDYGKLSGQKLSEQKSQKKQEPENERVPHDPKKRNQADFALWKPAKVGEPSWDSPWGRGRPGWHIECSAMSAHHLGFKFDIHGGGDDLKFPHHENEIAQSRAACQDSKVGYWLHNGRLNNDKGDKMSKSLGNYKTIREVTESYHPLALRYFFLTAHYRSPLNYDVSQLLRASDALYYIYQSLQDCDDALSAYGEGIQETGATESNSKTDQLSQEVEKCISNLKKDFVAKMSDDLNTSQILTGHAFQDALRTINKNIRSLKNKQTPSAIWSLVEIVKEVRKVLEILGLLPPLTYSEVLQQFKEYALKRAKISEDDLLRSIEDRAAFNKNREYEKGDQIREDMRKKGIEIMDEGGETIWRPRVPLQEKHQT